MKLPAQALHCQLFSCESWTEDESDKLYDQLDYRNLEVEFVSKKNDIYQILIKSIISNDSTDSEFSSWDEDWEEYKPDPESNQSVTVTCYINPNNFCYHLDGQQTLPGHAE